MKKQVRRLFPVYTKSAARNRLEITASVIIANEFYHITAVLNRTNKTAGDFVAGRFLCACIKSTQSLNYFVNSER